MKDDFSFVEVVLGIALAVPVMFLGIAFGLLIIWVGH